MKDYEELNNKLKDTEFELNLLEKEYVDLESKYILLKNENEELNENQKRNQRKNWKNKKRINRELARLFAYTQIWVGRRVKSIKMGIIWRIVSVSRNAKREKKAICIGKLKIYIKCIG